MRKYTPWPWRFIGEGIIHNEAGSEINLGLLYDEPDARLVAAALELLKALTRLALMTAGPGSLSYEQAHDQARAAIAKANGKVQA